MNALALSVSHTLDSSPKVGALGKTGNFAVLPKPLSLRKDFPRAGGRCRAATKGGVWHRAAMTERASTFPKE